MPYKRIDLTGKRFGKLVAISMNNELPRNGSTTYWNCLCDCGNMTIATTAHLQSGTKLSCGCLRKNDLTGKRFGRLTVIERSKDKYKTKSGKEYSNAIYICKCDCGNIVHCHGRNLIKGATTSCGCYQKETASKKFKTHGMRNSRLYNCWANMISRCKYKNNKSYKNYGGRGITVCNEWRKFKPFMEWAIKNGYSDELTLDRKDVNGNYCPENCRWATQSEQSNNRRKTIRIEILGEYKSLKQWTNYMGWKYGKYSARYGKGKQPFTEQEISLIEEKLRSEKNV